MESVDGDLETYPWEQVNAQAFSSEVPPGDVIVVVAGVDPASGLEWGYSYTSMPGEGPQLNRFGGVARTQADGSILQTVREPLPGRGGGSTPHALCPRALAPLFIVRPR